MNSYLYLVVTGNLSDGFLFHGPFLTQDDAAASAEASEPWSWIATLEEPVAQKPKEQP